MENEALEKLEYVKDSLEELSIEDCFNVQDSGLLSLSKLTNLKKLHICGLPYVKDMESINKELKSSLPSCDINVNNSVNLV